MDQRDTIRTGDVLLFSNNTPTGFLLRTFVSSEWNHSGIAVRFKEINQNGIPKKVISLTMEGELYILETNTGNRKDDIFNVDIIGAGFSRASMIFNKYNRVAVRRLHDVFRTPEFAQRTLEFAHKNRGSRFPSSSLPFISVWLGIDLQDKKNPENEMFCSELMAHYYSYTIGPKYHQLTGTSFDIKLSNLFGSEAPEMENMFTPGHYASKNTPNAPIFSGREELVFVVYADMLYVILQPFLIIIVIILALYMAFPK